MEDENKNEYDDGITRVKGTTSLKIHKEYLEIKQILEDSFWHLRYFLAMTEQVSSDVLIEYMEEQ